MSISASSSEAHSYSAISMRKRKWNTLTLFGAKTFWLLSLGVSRDFLKFWPHFPWIQIKTALTKVSKNVKRSEEETSKIYGGAKEVSWVGNLGTNLSTLFGVDCRQRKHRQSFRQELFKDVQRIRSSRQFLLRNFVERLPNIRYLEKSIVEGLSKETENFPEIV